MVCISPVDRSASFFEASSGGLEDDPDGVVPSLLPSVPLDASTEPLPATAAPQLHPRKLLTARKATRTRPRPAALSFASYLASAIVRRS